MLAHSFPTRRSSDLKQYLLTRMKEKQTFVTSCDDTAFLKTDGEVYRMNGGVLSRA